MIVNQFLICIGNLNMEINMSDCEGIVCKNLRMEDSTAFGFDHLYGQMLRDTQTKIEAKRTGINLLKIHEEWIRMYGERSWEHE
jgi:hypothetical protein